MSKKLEKQIEELKKRIEELEGKTEPAELPFWMPKLGERYQFMNTEGDALASLYRDDEFDKGRIAIGNYTETEEISEKRKTKLKLLEEIKQWRGKHDPESFKLTDYRVDLVYDPDGEKWDWLDFSDESCKHPFAISFSVVNLAEEFIKHFGKRLDILLEESN